MFDQMRHKSSISSSMWYNQDYWIDTHSIFRRKKGETRSHWNASIREYPSSNTLLSLLGRKQSQTPSYTHCTLSYIKIIIISDILVSSAIVIHITCCGLITIITNNGWDVPHLFEIESKWALMNVARSALFTHLSVHSFRLLNLYVNVHSHKAEPSQQKRGKKRPTAKIEKPIESNEALFIRSGTASRPQYGKKWKRISTRTHSHTSICCLASNSFRMFVCEWCLATSSYVVSFPHSYKIHINTNSLLWCHYIYYVHI